MHFFIDSFKDTYVPTIEDTYRQVICCNKNVCTLQITDTTGSHQFPAMQRLNISKGHAFMLVYRYDMNKYSNKYKTLNFHFISSSASKHFHPHNNFLLHTLSRTYLREIKFLDRIFFNCEWSFLCNEFNFADHDFHSS